MSILHMYKLSAAVVVGSRVHMCWQLLNADSDSVRWEVMQRHILSAQTVCPPPYPQQPQSPVSVCVFLFQRFSNLKKKKMLFVLFRIFFFPLFEFAVIIRPSVSLSCKQNNTHLLVNVQCFAPEFVLCTLSPFLLTLSWNSPPWCRHSLPTDTIQCENPRKVSFSAQIHSFF